jgi:hypothetical protein
MGWGVLGEHMRPLVTAMRKASVFGEGGRTFLVANAHAYGYEVDGSGNIIDKNGKVLSKDHEDYQSIIIRAQKQATTQSKEGEELLGD